jgi:hypothetical protein
MTYVRLEQRNDWGHSYLAMPGKALEGPWQTANQKLGIPFKDGQHVHVRWPDGSETEEVVTHRDFPFTISDHGHEYGSTDTRPGVETSARGFKHWTPLAELDVCVEDLP